MASRILYSFVNGKKVWINSGNESLDFSMVTVSNDPTNDNDVVRKSYIETLYLPLSEKGAANGVATLNADGKLTGSQVPAIAITDTFVVADEAAMLAIATAETGDVAVRTDISKCFILAGTDPSVLGDWQELLTPVSPVQSVNGQTGTVVLSTSEISEGANLYFTEERAKSAVVVTSFAGLEADKAPSVELVKSALDSKSDTSHNHDSTYAALSHLHAISDIDNLGTTLDAKVEKANSLITAQNDNGSSITLGQLVYLKENGNVDLAIATSLTTCGDVLGFVADSSIAPTSSGNIAVKAGERVTIPSGLNIGKLYYASADIFGGITDAPSVQPGHVLKPVLLAVSNSEGIFLPGQSEEIIS